MTNRIVLSAIAKRTDPTLSEDIVINPFDNSDYIFKTAIIFSEVVLYEEYNVNPDHPYYQYKGPLTRIGTDTYERMCLISFEQFDILYTNAMQGLINHKQN